MMDSLMPIAKGLSTFILECGDGHWCRLASISPAGRHRICKQKTLRRVRDKSMVNVVETQ